MYIIGFIKQKGGVGCSTLAFATAAEFTRAGWATHLADLDTSQSTNYHRQRRRVASNIEPHISVETYSNVTTAHNRAAGNDLLIYDTAPHATRASLEIAQRAHLTVIPTGLAEDDLRPTVLLAHELVKKGVDKNKIRVAFCRTSGSDRELAEARQYITDAGYQHIAGQMQEKPSFRLASDKGQSPTECQYPGPRKQAQHLVDQIIKSFEEVVA